VQTRLNSLHNPLYKRCTSTEGDLKREPEYCTYVYVKFRIVNSRHFYSFITPKQPQKEQSINTYTSVACVVLCPQT